MRVYILFLTVLIGAVIADATDDEGEIEGLGQFDVDMSGDSVEIPLKQFGNLTLIKASIGDGPERDFILDTGASASGINEQYYADNVIENFGGIECYGAEGSLPTKVVSVPSLKVGGVTVDQPMLMMHDYGPFFDPLGLEIGGIIGYDFISQFVVKLDYDSGIITLYDPDSFSPSPDIDFLSVDFTQNTPQIEISVNGDEGVFVFDLGNASGIILSGDYVSDNGLIEKAPAKIPVQMKGLGGDGGKGVTSYMVRFDEVMIGDYRVEEPIGILTGEGAVGCLGGERGNLGWGIISRFIVYLDYKNGRIGFTPGQRFGEPFDYNRSGVLAMPAGEYYAVDSVMEGVPAARVISAGDKIVAFEGQPAADFPYPEWIMLREGPAGSTFSVTIEKPDGTIEDVLIELVEIL